MISTTIKPPNTYSEWVELFNLLKNKSDDLLVLEAMLQGKIEWQSGVAERFATRLTDAINTRINMASDKFQREMNYARGQERVIIQALLSLRKEMCFLSKAIDLPAIPEKDRYQYYKLVREKVDSMQRSLEDSAKKDRTGKLASIVRNHKVNLF